ncbi:MAG: PA14 domain-containing protein [Verrucomicrobiales bacterium]|nr:PA14 domain-containing protein [Verrucomicrobiales bacterium]
MKRYLLPSLLAVAVSGMLSTYGQDQVLDLGKITFQSCVACHGPDGKGIKAGDLQMAPSLHDSEFIKGDNADLLTAVILKGILKEDNQYIQAMLPLELALNDEQIAALIAYITKEFGKKRRSPTANDVAKFRKEYADQKSPWKRKDLKEMIQSASAPQLLTDLKYSVYEGKWEELPDFSKLKPVKTGELKDGKISLDPARSIKGGFGMVFEGNLTLKDTAEYRFSITSDDGSALAVDGETVVGNDGIHPAKTQNMKETLEAGEHTLKALYFDGGGQRFLSLSIQGGKAGKVWLSKAQTANKGKSKDYDPIPLTAVNPGEAIVHRAFLPDSKPRAIGVGYPDAVNLVWDADTLNLAYVYRGAFMDASPHWNGRGSGSKPLGTDRVKVAPGLPLQVLESLDEPWVPFSEATIKYERDKLDPQKDLKFNIKHPDYQFRGYRLDKNRFPTFRYDYQNLTVTDRFTPEEIDGVTSVVRTLKLDGNAGENLYLRIAATGSLADSDGWYDLGGMKVKIDGADPVLRQVGGAKELLAPVSNDATLTITYRWNDPLKQ